MIKRLLVIGVFSLSALSSFTVSAATLQLDFGVSFGDPTDLDTAAPDGPAPWMTALFDDGGTAGSVSLTLTLGAVGIAEVTGVYLNVDDTIGSESLSITQDVGGGTGPTADSILQSTNTYKPDSDGLFDILINLPNNGDTFDANETLIFDITGSGLVASSFNYWSAPDPTELNPTGPFLGAAKFQSTGDGSQSDWVGAVPVPAAVWLFGSGLLGLVGLARRKKVA